MKKRYIAMLLLLAMLLSACNIAVPVPETTVGVPEQTTEGTQPPETTLPTEAITEPAQTTEATESTQPETEPTQPPRQPQTPTNEPEEETTESTQSTEPTQKEEESTVPETTVPATPTPNPVLYFQDVIGRRMKVGTSMYLKPEYTGQNKLTWSSQDPSVVTVERDTGFIVALKEGDTYITVTDGTLSAQQRVFVRTERFFVNITFSSSTDMSMDNTVRYAGTGAEMRLQLNLYSGDPDQQVQAVSGDEAVVSVSVRQESKTEFVVTLNFKAAGQTAVTYSTTDSSNTYVQNITVKAQNTGGALMTPQQWQAACNQALKANGTCGDITGIHYSEWYRIALSADSLTQKNAEEYAAYYAQRHNASTVLYAGHLGCVYVGVDAQGNHIFSFVTLGGSIGPDDRP